MSNESLSLIRYIIIWATTVGFIIGFLMIIIGLILQTVWSRRLSEFNKKHNIVRLPGREVIEAKVSNKHFFLVFLGSLIIMLGIITTFIFVLIGVILLFFVFIMSLGANKELKRYEKEHPEELQIMQQKIAQLNPEEAVIYQKLIVKEKTYRRIINFGFSFAFLMGFIWVVVAFSWSGPPAPVTGA